MLLVLIRILPNRFVRNIYHVSPKCLDKISSREFIILLNYRHFVYSFYQSFKIVKILLKNLKKDNQMLKETH